MCRMCRGRRGPLTPESGEITAAVVAGLLDRAAPSVIASRKSACHVPGHPRQDVDPRWLGLFLSDEQGQPLGRVPVYAEITLPAVVPVRPVDDRFDEALRAALFSVDQACARDAT